MAPTDRPNPMEQLIERASGSLTTILDAINEPLFVVDTDKKIVFFNREAEEITGFKMEDVVGLPCIVAIRCSNCLYECALFEDKSVQNRKLRIHDASGKSLDIIKNAEVFTDSEGTVIGGIEIFRDVTQSNRHRQRITAENSSIKSVFNHLEKGVMVLDTERQIMLCNDFFQNEFGHNPQHVRGDLAQDFFPDLDWKAVMEHEGTKEWTTRFLGADGELSLVHVTRHDISAETGAEAGCMLMLRKVRGAAAMKDSEEQNYSYRGLISKAPSMLELFKLSETISDSDVSVMIQGESGTGKEMLARAIHDASSRASEPFHVVNCAVFNENLLESELFGHCRGAFTGAVSDKVGRFELADKGTLFLDEIGEMPPNLQVKLLRFLQDQQFERVGEWKTRQVDVRIMAATNRNLTEAIETGDFRDDLYYRINVIPVFLPPLRERIEDVPLLLEYFINKISIEKRLPTKVLSEDALTLLSSYTWPGNIRELQNAVLHALTCCKNSVVLPRHLPRSVLDAAQETRPAGQRTIPQSAPASKPENLEELEREQIVAALKEHNFNRSKTADSLNITRTTLWRKMKRHQLL